MHEKKCKITHRQPQLNDRIKQELVLRRRLESKWLNCQTEYNFQDFYYQRQHISNVIKTVKKQNHISKLHENRDDFKQIFGITSKLLYRGQSLPLPPTDNLQQLVNDFSDFFKMKIDTIMINLRDNTNTNTHDEFIEHTPLTNITLTDFQPVTH